MPIAIIVIMVNELIFRALTAKPIAIVVLKPAFCGIKQHTNIGRINLILHC